jgi:hypothetical protein
VATQFIVKNKVAVVKIIVAVKIMCPNVENCPCPKTACNNYKQCCACIIKHKETDSLPFCLFVDNDGDKSLYNFYTKLKRRFEKQ